MLCVNLYITLDLMVDVICMLENVQNCVLISKLTKLERCIVVCFFVVFFFITQ